MSEVLTVNCSPTAKSLPIRMALGDGFFAARGIDLRLVSTENSKEQRTGLARGYFQLVHVAFDNAVSMKDVDGEDVVVVMGGDSGMNELFVQPEIASIEGIRGKRLIVDAPDTAFALQAYKILADHGLARDRDYEVKPVGRGELRIAAMQRCVLDHPGQRRLHLLRHRHEIPLLLDDIGVIRHDAMHARAHQKFGRESVLSGCAAAPGTTMHEHQHRCMLGIGSEPVQLLDGTGPIAQTLGLTDAPTHRFRGRGIARQHLRAVGDVDVLVVDRIQFGLVVVKKHRRATHAVCGQRRRREAGGVERRQHQTTAFEASPAISTGGTNGTGKAGPPR